MCRKSGVDEKRREEVDELQCFSLMRFRVPVPCCGSVFTGESKVSIDLCNLVFGEVGVAHGEQ